MSRNPLITSNPLGLLRTMRQFVTALLLATLWVCVAFESEATDCKVKVNRLKTDGVCGVIQNSSGAPIKGATVQIISEDGKPLSAPGITDDTGHFEFVGVTSGDAVLAATAANRNPVKWPITLKPMNAQEVSTATMMIPTLCHCAICGTC